MSTLKQRFISAARKAPYKHKIPVEKVAHAVSEGIINDLLASIKRTIKDDIMFNVSAHISGYFQRTTGDYKNINQHEYANAIHAEIVSHNRIFKEITNNDIQSYIETHPDLKQRVENTKKMVDEHKLIPVKYKKYLVLNTLEMIKTLDKQTHILFYMCQSTTD